MAAPRCCAPLALTQPPPAKGLHASTRCPAEATTLIGIRVFFGGYHTYRFAYLSFAYPPHIINSRIYDVGINCHKYVKYVDSRIVLLCVQRHCPTRAKFSSFSKPQQDQMQTAAIYMCPIWSFSGEAQWGQDRHGEPVDDGPQALKEWMEAEEGDGEQKPGCKILTQPA